MARRVVGGVDIGCPIDDIVDPRERNAESNGPRLIQLRLAKWDSFT
jgi:hypothetical protein